MYFENRQLTGHPSVDRLINKRDETQADIHALQKELEVIKDVIQSKHRRISKMNRRIILKQRSANYLKLVSVQPSKRFALTKPSKSAPKSPLKLRVVM